MKILKKCLIMGGFLGVLVVPNISSAVSAVSVAELQTQILKILSQVQVLQGQLTILQEAGNDLEPSDLAFLQEAEKSLAPVSFIGPPVTEPSSAFLSGTTSCVLGNKIYYTYGEIHSNYNKIRVYVKESDKVLCDSGLVSGVSASCTDNDKIIVYGGISSYLQTSPMPSFVNVSGFDLVNHDICSKLEYLSSSSTNSGTGISLPSSSSTDSGTGISLPSSVPPTQGADLTLNKITRAEAGIFCKDIPELNNTQNPYGCSALVGDIRFSGPGSMQNNKPFTVKMGVKNQGNQDSGTFTVKIWKSVDAVPGNAVQDTSKSSNSCPTKGLEHKSDALLATWDIGGLKAGEAIRKTFDNLSTSGWLIHSCYFYIIEIDAGNKVAESNESNNIVKMECPQAR